MVQCGTVSFLFLVSFVYCLILVWPLPCHSVHRCFCFGSFGSFFSPSSLVWFDWAFFLFVCSSPLLTPGFRQQLVWILFIPVIFPSIFVGFLFGVCIQSESSQFVVKSFLSFQLLSPSGLFAFFYITDILICIYMFSKLTTYLFMYAHILYMQPHSFPHHKQQRLK